MSEITVNDFYQHIGKLRDLITDKNGYFDALLTYAIALEQGITKGFHAHLALVLIGLSTRAIIRLLKG